MFWEKLLSSCDQDNGSYRKLLKPATGLKAFATLRARRSSTLSTQEQTKGQKSASYWNVSVNVCKHNSRMFTIIMSITIIDTCNTIYIVSICSVTRISSRLGRGHRGTGGSAFALGSRHRGPHPVPTFVPRPELGYNGCSICQLLCQQRYNAYVTKIQ